MKGVYLCQVSLEDVEKLCNLGFKHIAGRLYYCQMISNDLSISIIFPYPSSQKTVVGSILVIDEQNGRIYDSCWHDFPVEHFRRCLEETLDKLPIKILSGDKTNNKQI